MDGRISANFDPFNDFLRTAIALRVTVIFRSIAMYPVNQYQQILDAIAQLSDRQLQLVWQFIQTLQPQPIPNLPETTTDPLADFIGATNPGNLARDIDETLYE